MKTIEQLINSEKAKLLHQLFRNEIPDFITFTANTCATIKEEEQAQRANWDNGLMDFDFWLYLVNDAEKRIQQYGVKLYKSSQLFADQLFDGYGAMYMVHCLNLYTTIRQHPNRKFSLAVELLFL